MNWLSAYFPVDPVRWDAIIYLAPLSTLLCGLAFWLALANRHLSAARIDAASRRRSVSAAASSSAVARNDKRAGVERLLMLAIGHARKMRLKQSDRLRTTLLQSGFRSPDAIMVYGIAKLVLPIGFLAAELLVVRLGRLFAEWSLLQALLMAVTIIFGFLLPDLLLLNRRSKRLSHLQTGLPDSLDLLVVCAEAGLSLDTALSRVAAEIRSSAPDLASELSLTGIELNFLPERRIALDNLAKRVPLPAMRGVVGTLIQTERYGTPLAQSLRVLSAEFRDRRMLDAEAKAARLPAILTVPMILFILPTLFVVLIGPAAIEVYDNLAR